MLHNKLIGLVQPNGNYVEGDPIYRWVDYFVHILIEINPVLASGRDSFILNLECMVLFNMTKLRIIYVTIKV